MIVENRRVMVGGGVSIGAGRLIQGELSECEMGIFRAGFKVRKRLVQVGDACFKIANPALI